MPSEAKKIIDHYNASPLVKGGLGRISPFLKTFQSKDKNVLICISGIGKIYAAIATTNLLCSFPQIKTIINSGIAGALDTTLQPGDIVMGTKVIQHDTYIPEELDDTDLKNPIQLQSLDIPKTQEGSDIKGEQLIDRAKKKKELALQGIVCEMECYAIAKAAAMFETQVIALKAISDTADNTATLDLPKNMKLALQNLFQSTIAVIEQVK